LAKLIETIINDKANSQQSRFGGPPRPTPTFGSGFRSGGSSGRQGGMQISKIIADDRTNTLIVKANAVGINEIRALVNKLDTKVNSREGSGRIHVVRLQFANAEEIAKTMGSITQSAGKSGANANRFGGFPPFGDAPSNAQVFQGDIKISADKFTQSLVITASPQDFVTLKKVIETLDVPRDQVFVEAVIMEIAINRDSSFGTSFISTPNGIALPSANKSLDAVLGAGNPLGLGGLVLGFKSGASREFTVGSGTAAQTIQVNTVNGLIDLILGNTDSNVVATPQLIALDNQAAEITISDTIPEPTGATTVNNVTTNGGFTQKEAALKLKVTPQINKGSDFVKLDIEQQLENFTSALVPQQLQGVTQGKSKRETKTSVIVENEDTVVISGLMKDATDEVTKKIPILGDIPLLGWLFKNKKTRSSKTNLLVFITPRIIKQYDSIRKILESRLAQRDEFVRETVGNIDPSGKHIEAMRKSLPPIGKLSPLPEARTIESKSFNSPSSPSSDNDDNDEYEPWNDPGNAPYISQPMDVPPSIIDNAAPPPVMPMDNPGGYQ
jgi:general secretion pathway protein D